MGVWMSSRGPDGAIPVAPLSEVLGNISGFLKVVGFLRMDRPNRRVPFLPSFLNAKQKGEAPPKIYIYEMTYWLHGCGSK